MGAAVGAAGRGAGWGGRSGCLCAGQLLEVRLLC